MVVGELTNMVQRNDGSASPDPLNRIRGILIRAFSAWVSRTYPFASVGRNLLIHYRSDFVRSHAHRFKIGDSVSIDKDVTLIAATQLEEQGEPLLVIDDGCVIGPRCTISAKNRIHIEKDVELGASVLMQDHSHAYRDVRLTIRNQGVTEGGTIRIGEGSSIGQGAVIHCDQDELVLGRNCVVAPNSLVNRSFPAYSLIAGNPARVVKQFDPVKSAWVLGSSRPAAESEIVQPQVELVPAR